MISIGTGILAGIIFDEELIPPTIIGTLLLLGLTSITTEKPRQAKLARTKNENYIKRSIDPSGTYHHWPQTADFAFEVVGESFYQDNIAKIADAHATENDDEEFRDFEIAKAYLIPDDLNPYDNKAVRVDIDGKTVGHLGKDDARSFRRRLAAKKLSNQITTCDAMIIGGYTKDDEQKSYGIALDMQPFE
jgi:hypothetical protein